MQFKLLIGTNNRGKVEEYSRLLNNLPIALTTPQQERITGDPNETGASFSENALIKAQYYASKTGLPTLADDSGLEVDIARRRPGRCPLRGADRFPRDQHLFQERDPWPVG